MPLKNYFKMLLDTASEKFFVVILLGKKLKFYCIKIIEVLTRTLLIHNVVTDNLFKFKIYVHEKFSSIVSKTPAVVNVSWTQKRKVF